MEGMRRARQGASEPAGPTTRLFALGNLPDTVTAVSQRMMKMEALKSFRSSIEEQPEEERRLLVHCGLEGLPHKEVAERLGLPIATVTKRWQRLRQRLLEEGIPETLLILS
jgi:RNA polymerase sigma factor (sigma-70 family)